MQARTKDIKSKPTTHKVMNKIMLHLFVLHSFSILMLFLISTKEVVTNQSHELLYLNLIQSLTHLYFTRLFIVHLPPFLLLYNYF